MPLTCSNHPRSTAEYTCFDCRGAICEVCVRTRDDGVIVCPACLAGDIELAGEQPKAAFDWRPGPPARPCVNHPQVASVKGCSACGQLICATCDFVFDDMHICPQCAVSGTQAVTPLRKKMGIWGLVLAIVNVPVSVVGLLVLILVLPKLGAEAAVVSNVGSSLVVIIGLGLAVAGFLLGLYAFERKSVNPVYFWFGPVINGLIGAFWILLMGVGLLAAL